MPAVMLIAIAVVLAGVFFVATGRGGELASERADHAPLDMGPVTAADIAMLRPPTALWGYNMQVTDEALDAISRAMRDRDVTIAYLQQQLANLDPSYTSDFRAFTRPAAPADPDATQVFRATPARQTPFVHRASPAPPGDDADTTTFRAPGSEDARASSGPAPDWRARPEVAGRGAAPPGPPSAGPTPAGPTPPGPTPPGLASPGPTPPGLASPGSHWAPGPPSVPDPAPSVAATRPQPIMPADLPDTAYLGPAADPGAADPGAGGSEPAPPDDEGPSSYGEQAW